MCVCVCFVCVCFCMHMCVCARACACVRMRTSVLLRSYGKYRNSPMPRFQTDRYGGGIVHVLAPNPGRDAAVPSAGQQVAFVIQHGQDRTLQVEYRHYSEVSLAGMYIDVIEGLLG